MPGGVRPPAMCRQASCGVWRWHGSRQRWQFGMEVKVFEFSIAFWQMSGWSVAGLKWEKVREGNLPCRQKRVCNWALESENDFWWFFLLEWDVIHTTCGAKC